MEKLIEDSEMACEKLRDLFLTEYLMGQNK